MRITYEISEGSLGRMPPAEREGYAQRVRDEITRAYPRATLDLRVSTTWAAAQADGGRR